MPDAILKLSVDPVTGKRTVTIGYTSDLDALPHEHEDAHRELVEKIFERGIARPGDTIVVTREGGAVPASEERAEEEAAAAPRKAHEGA